MGACILQMTFESIKSMSNKVKIWCHSLENFEHAKTEMVDCNAGLEINLHWNIGEVDDDDTSNYN